MATVESSLWFRWPHSADLGLIWGPLPVGALPWKLVVFVLTEMALLGFYVYYLGQAWRRLMACRRGHRCRGIECRRDRRSSRHDLDLDSDAR